MELTSVDQLYLKEMTMIALQCPKLTDYASEKEEKVAQQCFFSSSEKEKEAMESGGHVKGI